MKQLKTFSVLVVIVTVLFSCSKDESENSTSEIYYRWIENLAHPPGASHCESVASYYTNSHPDIPDKAEKNKFYAVSPRQLTCMNQSVPLTIEAPAKGYRRYYTHIVQQYYSSLNQCLYTIGDTSAFTYIDEPIN